MPSFSTGGKINEVNRTADYSLVLSMTHNQSSISVKAILSSGSNTAFELDNIKDTRLKKCLNCAKREKRLEDAATSILSRDTSTRVMTIGL